MPRITVVTNRCNVCKKTHRPNPDEDDSDRLEAGTEDTDLPIFWTEVTLRSKQPNPDFAKNERKVQKAISQWPQAAAELAQQRGGRPLDGAEIEELKEFLEDQARDRGDPSELIVAEAEILLCETCTPLLANLGLLLTELTANGVLPPAWVPAAAPMSSGSPHVAVASAPVPQPSAPPLAVVPAAPTPAPAPTHEPEPAPPSAA